MNVPHDLYQQILSDIQSNRAADGNDPELAVAIINTVTTWAIETVVADSLELASHDYEDTELDFGTDGKNAG